MKACPDQDGSALRAERFVSGCDRLCENGYGSDCPDESAARNCFRETSFNINQRDIELGKLLGISGFANGNFNYRIDGIGINFVGTALANCKDSPSPQSCYAKGNVQYTIEHGGPYIVRNHFGRDFRAALFEGKIEHARGLSIERYFTNPISQTDKTLLSDYMRHELQGRPLDGNFRLKIWDDPSVNFEAIQDVQIILYYRYWTRFK